MRPGLRLAPLFIWAFVILGPAGCSVGHRTVERERFQHLYRTRKVRCILIDARSPEDFARGRMKGAVNISAGDPRFPERLDGLAREANLLFIYGGSEEETERLKEKLMGIYSWYIISSPYGIYYMKEGYLK